MYDLLAQLGSILGDIHSISDTFIADSTLLDVIILPGSRPGICFSHIPDDWDLSMALLPLLGNDLALRDAAYAHSRLILASPHNVSSTRVLKYSLATPSGLRLLQSGNATFELGLQDAVESTFNDLQLNKCMNPQLVLENMDTIEAAMEEMCQNWLIALLSILALLPYDQKDMTAEFQLTVKMLMDSICLAIHEEDASAQNPSPVQSRFAKTLGRLMAQWSPAPFFMDYVDERRYQWYYFDVAASLRQDFSSWAEPALVPNYLPREISQAVSMRRKELEDCRKIGTPPTDFGEILFFALVRFLNFQQVLPLKRTPRVYGNGPLVLKSTKIPEFNSFGVVISR
ncbi:hypothetical protein B0H14DRAFT_2592068 [Mycena olivaceomarginata]|nr:hypothetical protein B0H14DRAFT_2592068 [Mycena olivaceomarginata]